MKPKPVYEPALPVFVESRSLCSGGRPCTQTCTGPQSEQSFYTTRLDLILQKLVKWVKPKPVYEPALPVFVESRSICSGGRPCTQTCTVPQSEQSFYTTRLDLMLQKLVKWVKPKPVYEPALPVFVVSRSLCSGGRPCTQTCTVPQSEQSFYTTRLDLMLQKLVKWVKPKPVYEPALPVFVVSRSLCSGGRPCTQTCTGPQSEPSPNAGSEPSVSSSECRYPHQNLKNTHSKMEDHLIKPPADFNQ